MSKTEPNYPSWLDYMPHADLNDALRLREELSILDRENPRHDNIYARMIEALDAWTLAAEIQEIDAKEWDHAATVEVSLLEEKVASLEHDMAQLEEIYDKAVGIVRDRNLHD